MRATTVASAPSGEESLDAVLRPIHNIWVEETRRFLEPTLEPGADFWARWGDQR